jgi:hypothetical protein
MSATFGTGAGWGRWPHLKRQRAASASNGHAIVGVCRCPRPSRLLRRHSDEATQAVQTTESASETTTAPVEETTTTTTAATTATAAPTTTTDPTSDSIAAFADALDTGDRAGLALVGAGSAAYVYHEAVVTSAEGEAQPGSDNVAVDGRDHLLRLAEERHCRLPLARCGGADHGRHPERARPWSSSVAGVCERCSQASTHVRRHSSALVPSCSVLRRQRAGPVATTVNGSQVEWRIVVRRLRWSWQVAPFVVVVVEFGGRPYRCFRRRSTCSWPEPQAAVDVLYVLHLRRTGTWYVAGPIG